MATLLSPGVSVTEIDLTTVVPSVSTSSGAYAGYFSWGPVGQIVQIPDEITLVNTFGEPDSNSATSFFTSASFLTYGNNLNIVRSVGANAFNAVANTSGSNVQVQNSAQFQEDYLLLNTTTAGIMARYPGALGNSIGVSICANTSTFANWTYANYFSSAPGTSSSVASVGGSNDELHIIVYDQGGLFTGTQGTVLETYGFVSKAQDATLNGASNYYKQVVFNQSNYIYVSDTNGIGEGSSNWGAYSANTTFFSPSSTTSFTLTNGTDDCGTDATTETAWSLFANKVNIDIDLVLTGGADVTLQQYIIDNIADSRLDCVAFISPPQSAVVNQSGSEVTNIQTWLTSLARSSSYVVADSGWKYMFDKYNNVYRWVPLNGDIAGLCAYTDQVRDAWWSPAGFNRGAIKNAIKLAWNPSQSYRDTLYSAGVNPVVSFPGQGIVLFGDKTLQAKPSAFDRINVRRLFIVLEKSISTAAQYSLFEFNDTYTQSAFVAMVTPYLRDVQGRRGITDFKVVCDSTNNTPQVIDSNQFVGDIYIKPARSINYIQLNFVAVATGVDFTTVVGAA